MTPRPLPPDYTTLRRISAFASEWRRHGWRWLAARLFEEIRSPCRLFGKLYRVATVVRHVGLAAVAGASGSDDSRVTAFYDLDASPTTFDVLWALAGAECRRKASGAGSIRFVIVPGRYHGIRREHSDYERAIPVEARIARVERIVMACARLVPTVTEIVAARDRQHAVDLRCEAGNVYPPDYWPQFPAAHHPRDVLDRVDRLPDLVRAPDFARDAIAAEFDARIAGRRLVVITLRAYAEAPARNSAVDQWISFARTLDPGVYQVVFVPDTSAPESDDALLSPFPVARSASRDVALRLAMYERAWLSLFVNNGPYALCAFSARCRYVMLKILTPDVPQTDAAYLQELGFEIGGTPRGANPFQAWIWADDSTENIRSAFDAMARRMDGECETVAGSKADG